MPCAQHALRPAALRPTAVPATPPHANILRCRQILLALKLLRSKPIDSLKLREQHQLMLGQNLVSWKNFASLTVHTS
jgi:hypothetical protein